uniref:NADH-ubiquinone oxidoreductase chain 6 n=1 Tax=Pseudolycoriella sp. XQM-2020 TaxID=2715250 RepID=A0A6G7GC65_9DIPT|nr:NADH dehydrogenase subunit 6 [Pseudolycoriella sp. XQM-2020]
MMQSILNLLLFTFSIVFLQLNHPLAMGFLMLIQTITICLLTGVMIESFWFSYILFLVFLGGMLVLFIYVTSLASNEMFSFSFKILYSMILIIMLISMLYYFMNFYFKDLNNLDMNPSLNKLINLENYKSILKLYNYPTNFLTILLINYLFFTLIVTVKITNFYYGPIRNLN